MIRSRNSDNSGAARAQRVRWQASAGGPRVTTNIGSIALGGILCRQQKKSNLSQSGKIDVDIDGEVIVKKKKPIKIQFNNVST